MTSPDTGSPTPTDATVDLIVQEQLVAQRAASSDRRESLIAATRQVVIFLVFVALLGATYVGYKAFGQSIDDAQADWPVVGSMLPKTDDITMPPLGDILAEFGEVPRGEDQTYGGFLFDEALFTLREAALGFVVGVLLGMSIAIALVRSRWMERAFLPYVVASQTIPLIAIAPIIVIWGRQNLGFLPGEPDWVAVSIIATYLTFFPVAVNGLRGLQSPRAENMELMDSYAATWGQSLWRLRLPASVPYLFASFKIAATASVVGAIVGEISAGVQGGLGRRILLELQRYTTGPERLYAAVIASAILGIFVYLIVIAFERVVLSQQGREAVT